MTDNECQPVTVSRRISAPAHDIFRVLADPARHVELDGSESLRGAGSTAMIAGVGDVFVMKMYYPHLGDYEMNNHVIEYEPDRLIGWEPEAGRGHPDAAPDSAEPARWGHRWSYQLTPDGPDATIVTEIYDCSRAPTPSARHEERPGLDREHGQDPRTSRRPVHPAGKPAYEAVKRRQLIMNFGLRTVTDPSSTLHRTSITGAPGRRRTPQLGRLRPEHGPAGQPHLHPVRHEDGDRPELGGGVDGRHPLPDRRVLHSRGDSRPAPNGRSAAAAPPRAPSATRCRGSR